MADKVQTRETADWIGTAFVQRFSGGVMIENAIGKYVLGGRAQITSSGHPVHLIGKGGDVGGPFGASSCNWVNSPFQVNIDTKTDPSDTTYYVLNLPLSAWYSSRSGPPTFFAEPAKVPDNQMNALGASGISRSIPTNPLAGLATFTGELRQLPQAFNPHKWKEALKDLRKLPRRTAEEWLNFNFGYVPIVNDIKKFHKVTTNHAKYAERLVRNSGKDVRRGATVYNNAQTFSEVISENAYGDPPLPVDAYVKTGTVRRDITLNQKCWFKGAFTYHLPDPGIDKWLGDVRELRIRQILYGSKVVDIDTLWNLAPWTWALDWMTNAGDVLHNLNSFTQDGLVMRYGYIMYQSDLAVTFSLDGLILKDQGGVSAKQTCFLTSKQRSKATPYGFGLDPGTFSARQVATIAALGITRGGNR